MAKKRKYIPKTTEKRVFQETGSTCAFCKESEITALEIHHIDSNPENNELENLIVVCSSCHSKITSGVISPADVDLQKRMAMYGALKSDKKDQNPTSQTMVTEGDNYGEMNNTINNYYEQKPQKSKKVQHPQGSVGANLHMKGYIDYLISRYFDFKKADSSFGQKQKFNHFRIHKNIQDTIGYKTFFTPETLFENLSKHIKQKIDGTILGKNNTSNGKPNYHSFEEHLKKHNKSL